MKRKRTLPPEKVGKKELKKTMNWGVVRKKISEAFTERKLAYRKNIRFSRRPATT